MSDKKPTYQELEERIKELLLSVKRQRYMLDSMNDCIFIRLPEGRFLEMNEVACRVYGYRRQELLQMTPMDLDIAEHAEQVPSRTKRILEDGSAIFETVHRTKDGTIIHAEISSRPITYDGNQAILSVIRDITGRKIIEEELNKHRKHLEALVEERTAALVEANDELIEHMKERKIIEETLENQTALSQEYINSLPGLFYVFDEERLVRWNSAWQPYTGYSDEELEGMYGTDFFEGEDKKLIAEQMQVVFEQGEADAEAELVTKDGRKIPYYFTGVRKKLNGKDYIVGLGIEITRRKRVEEELKIHKDNLEQLVKERTDQLQLSEERFRQLADALPDIIMRWVPNIGLEYVNPAMERILGFKKDALLRNWGAFMSHVHPDDMNIITNTFQDLAGRREDVKSIEYRVIKENGDTVWLEVAWKPNWEDNGQLKTIDAIARDITDRKKAEMEKEELQNQLIHAQKMEAIGHLAGGMAHEFNNLISIISGTAEMLARTSKAESKEYIKIQRILKSSKRAKDITSNLLAFARKEGLNVVTTSLNDLIRDLIEVLKGTIPKKIKIIPSLCDEPFGITADVNQITQALLNICLNACDAMPDGGSLIIESNKVDILRKQADGDGGCAEKFCSVTISDTGKGIEQSIRDKIFNPFFTTKERGKGSGLGLSVSHGIIEAHNGIIELEKTGQHGTTFKIMLPASEKDAESEQVVQYDTASLSKRRRIVVIDDNDDFLQMIQEALEAEGYDVFITKSAEDGIKEYEKNKDIIDIVLLDFIMPEMDAWDVFTVLKGINPEVRVLIVSGYSEEGGIAELLNAGAKGVVQKPFEIRKLCAAINDVIHA